MILKFFVIKVDFKPELGKNQKIQILLNSKNELPSACSVDEIREALGQDIEIGNTFYKDSNKSGIFANLPVENLEKLSSEWELRPFDSLRPDNCPDYKIIVDGIQKAGYETISQGD